MGELAILSPTPATMLWLWRPAHHHLIGDESARLVRAVAEGFAVRVAAAAKTDAWFLDHNLIALAIYRHNCAAFHAIGSILSCLDLCHSHLCTSIGDMSDAARLVWVSKALEKRLWPNRPG